MAHTPVSPLSNAILQVFVMGENIDSGTDILNSTDSYVIPAGKRVFRLYATDEAHIRVSTTSTPSAASADDFPLAAGDNYLAFATNIKNFSVFFPAGGQLYVSPMG